MPRSHRIGIAQVRRRSSCPRRFALLMAGATALLATACGSSLGYKTPCSTWDSMDSSDQRSTVVALYEQEGAPSSPSSFDLSNFERLASDYCSDPLGTDDTIGGMLDSRPS